MSGAARGSLRRWWPWLVLGAGVLAVALARGPSPRKGPPLDPQSAAPTGTKALVDVLRRLGSRVDILDRVRGEATAAVLLSDDLAPAERGSLADWVEGGGTLLLADPDSPLLPAPPAGSTDRPFLDPVLRPRCGAKALVGVRRVFAPGAVYDVPPGATGCVTTDDGAWLLLVPKGKGTLVVAGGAGAFTNANLGKEDNGLLAVNLLAPRPGGQVAVLRPAGPGGGRRSLADLVPISVKLALTQLAVAFVLLALWRARRLGRPVLESQPVQLAGSELVVGTGELFQRAKSRQQAAGILREDLRRNLAERLGLPAGTPPSTVAEVAAARTGTPAATVLEALAGPSVDNEADLLATARAVESIREEVVGAR